MRLFRFFHDFLVIRDPARHPANAKIHRDISTGIPMVAHVMPL